MIFNYNEEEKTPMFLVLENGISVEGEFIDLRIAPKPCRQANNGVR